MIFGNRGHRATVVGTKGRTLPRKAFRWLAALLAVPCVLPLRAESQTYAPLVLAPPIVDRVDANDVSMITGKTQFSVPALKMGDVSFTPYSVNGSYFGIGAIMDDNYGRLADCTSVNGNSYSSYVECTSQQQGIQAVYGEQRDTFDYDASSNQYTPDAEDGATFVDNGTTCTWTRRDGMQVVYAAYHNSGNPICQSNNILKVTQPDGRIITYYYYGAFSTGYATQSPILSIVTNSGYMLKYNYSGTPTAGGETSVTAINRAFETCDPSALSCTLAHSWPTSTLSHTTRELTSNCDDFSNAPGYDPCKHYILTIRDQAQRNYVFELDGYTRVVSYQPPEATGPVFYYSLCSQLADNTLRNCWDFTRWPPQVDPYDEAVEPMVFDWVYSVTRHDPSQPSGPNGPTWSYGFNFTLNSPPGWAVWEHSVNNPLGGAGMSALGNGTPGTENFYGPTDSITPYDGTVFHFERNRQNDLSTVTTPGGVTTLYCYDMNGSTLRGNPWEEITTVPGGSATCTGTISGSAITKKATYPTSCTNMASCNKPLTVTDANSNTSTFTYDSRGEVLTTTGPAVNGVQPQTRYTYAPHYAWYLSSSGVMTEDPNPIWLLATESYCMTGAASGSGCALPNDQVLTTYDYGPVSGPNNLLVRGKTVTANGQTLRTCYGHDDQGNKIWQTSPNANPSSCPAY